MFRHVPFAPQVHVLRRFVRSSAGGGATTVALPGQATTTEQGTPAVLFDAILTPSGQEVALSQGEFTYVIDVVEVLVGQEAVFAQGAIPFPSTNGNRFISFDPSMFRNKKERPLGPLEIDWANPLTKDLHRVYLAVDGELREYINQTTLAVSSGVTSYTDDGVYANSGTSGTTFAEAYPKQFGMSALTGYIPVDVATSGYHVWWYNATNLTDGFGDDNTEIHFGVFAATTPYYSFTVALNPVYAGSGYSNVLSGVTPVVGQLAIIGGRVSDDGYAQVFVDGDLKATATQMPSIGTPGTINYTRINVTPGDSGRHMRGYSPFLFTWTRALSYREMAEISDDPYQIFKQPSFPFIGSSGALTLTLTGQSLTASYNNLSPGAITSISSDDVLLLNEANAAIVGFGFTGKTAVKLIYNSIEVAQTGVNVASDTSADFDVVQGNLPYGTVVITFE